jgi:putative ABC transport system ATP-binding protein
MIARSENSPLLQIEDLSKSYQQGVAKVHALADINLEICNGEFAALAGPSGSGKTTLLTLIGALDKPTAGRIVLGGEEIGALSRARLAELRLRKIGFIFQDYNLLPVLSAVENVEYVLLLQGVPADERHRRADQVLIELGLDGCQHRRPNQLSGGQQQRVAIARAIVGEPLLVLADEPTANLDSQTGAALMETMLALNRTRGTTFIFSTHDEMVLQYATRTIHLKDGTIVDCAVKEKAHAVR